MQFISTALKCAIFWILSAVYLHSAQAGPTPRIAVSTTPLSLPFYVAQELNLFREQGVNPDIIECVGGVNCLKLALSGQADYATCSELPIVYSSFNRSDFSVLATFVSNPQDMRLLVRSELLAENFPESLKGIKVGVVARSASHYYSDLVLLLHGIAPSEVKRVPLKPAEMQQAFSEGRVDAVSIWEPFAYRIQNALNTKVQAVNDLSVFTQTFNLVGRNDSIKGDLDQNVALLKALQKASEFIEANPEKAKAILKRRLNLDQDFVAHSFSQHNYNLSVKQSLLSSMLNQRAWVDNHGYVQATADGSQILDLLWVDPLQKVDTDLVDLPAGLSP